MTRTLTIAWALALALAGCRGEAEDVPATSDEPPRPVVDDLDPPHARWRQVEDFRADLAAPRHPSDGRGEARLVLALGERAEVVAGGRASWTIEYTAGEGGLAPGAVLYFMPEPFWGWSTPQNHDPTRMGYVTVESDIEGLELDTHPDGRPQGAALFRVVVGGTGLAEGQSLRLRYGNGEGGAQADLYAERGARLWIAVDGDGDGVRVHLESSPTIEVLPGAPDRLVLHGPSTARPGDAVEWRLAVIDVAGNWVRDVEGELEWLDLPEDWEAPAAERLDRDDGGARAVHGVATSAGIVRARARLTLPDGPVLEARANPLIVHELSTPVLWGDLHGHSNLSDGTGLPEDYFRYARDVAALDVVALTDHDHFGVRFLDQHPALWDGIRDQVRAFHEPGRFVTLLGYEWTSWIHGHRHVLYFGDEGEILSSVVDGPETPRELWDALRGLDALTLTHHSAGAPIPTNWSFAPDPVLEPLAEIMSVHGSSEAADSPARLRGAIPGNFVRDVLERGYRLGFVGSGDSHDGHPGLPHLDPTYGYRPARPDAPPTSAAAFERVGNGGVAGIRANERTRSAVLEAFRARHVYATSGPRLLLRVTLDGRHHGGDRVARAELGDRATLTLDVFACAPLERIDLIRSGGIVESMGMGGEVDAHATWTLDALDELDFVYVRVVQQDGGLAWSSPIFLE